MVDNVNYTKYKVCQHSLEFLNEPTNFIRKKKKIIECSHIIPYE